MTKLLMPAVQTIVITSLAVASVVGVTRLIGSPSLSINQVSTMKQSTFDVTGESKITTVPDQAEVRLGLTLNQPTVKAVQDQANSTMNAITTELAQLGIEKKDIKTDNYSLFPNYDYQANSQRITGYTVNATLVVTTQDFDKVNQAIDAATRVGANQIGGVSFSLSDKKKAETEEQARKEAIDNAKTKASELAKLAGMRLGKIVNVYESPTSPDVYPMMRSAAMSDKAVGMGGGMAEPTAVEPGTTNYSYSVTLSYETL